MLNVTKLLAKHCVEDCTAAWQAAIGRGSDAELDELYRAIDRAFGLLTTTNAFYHAAEHTALVTYAAQRILAGLASTREVTHRDWLSSTVACLYHDIGFVRGILEKDSTEEVETGISERTAPISVRRNDAAMLPLHVDRGLKFTADLLNEFPLCDRDMVLASIERTRFPVPSGTPYDTNDDFPGYVRAADLIGQLADPRYLQKLPALYSELLAAESPFLASYPDAAEMLTRYPEFFREHVTPYIGEAVQLLETSDSGTRIRDQLYANLDAAANSNDSEILASTAALR